MSAAWARSCGTSCSAVGPRTTIPTPTGSTAARRHVSFDRYPCVRLASFVPRQPFHGGKRAADACGLTSGLDAGPFRIRRPGRRPALLAGRDRRLHGLVPDPHPGRRSIRPARRAVRPLGRRGHRSLTRDVLGTQLPLVPAHAALVTCGIGVNDILYTSPAKLFADLRALIAAVPDQTVLLDLPLPSGCWGLLGRASVPYLPRITRPTHQAAAARGLPVAEVSAHFLPPWAGKFASDCFHPSQDGYRVCVRALLSTVHLKRLESL